MSSAETGSGPGRAPGDSARPPRRPHLRTGFLAAVLLGAIVPMALVGLWLVQSTQRSAEVLVRERLQETLADLALETSVNWGRERGRLLRLAESVEVRELLARDVAEGPGATWNGTLPSGLADLWDGLEGVVQRAVIRDGDDRVRLELDRETPGETARLPLESALLSVQLPVHAAASGDRLGAVEAWIPAASLIPGAVVVPGVGGSVFALFDPSDGTSLLPLPMEPEVFHADRFEWRGEGWVTARRRLYEPPLVLALAAPLGAFSQPFEQAGRRGLIALIVVGVLAFLLVGLASRRLTRPLAALAEGAGDVTAGRLERDVAEEGPDEVFRVAQAFNAMTASLRRTLDRLSQQEALAAMGEMAASLAHEVRNPLTAIRLDLQRAERRLEGAEADEGARDLVQRALQELQRLDESVSEALQMARAGRVAYGPLKLAEPLGAALHAAAPAFRQKGVELEADPDPGRGVQVTGDAATLKQLFLNLLLNAAEALEEGGRAGVRVEGIGDRVRVSVWDQGPGIPPELRDRVLEPFFSTRPEGTGLGLTIARRIAHAHGGDLEIESRPGGGTVVTAILVRAEERPTA
jgi:signal transduction histidine kinase